MENNTNAQEKILRYKFKTSEENIKEALKIADKISRPKNIKGIFVLGLLMTVAGVALSFALGEVHLIPIGVLIACGGVYILGKNFLKPILDRNRMSKKISEKGLDYEIEFDSVEFNLYIGSSVNKRTIPYRSIFVRDAENVLVIVISTGEVIAVPKECLGEDKEVVSYLLRNNIGDRYAKI